MPRTVILLVFLLINVFFSPAAWAESEEVRIAVMDFHLSGEDIPDRKMGRAVADMFITSLVRDERLKIVERDTLKEVLDEQALAMSGIVDEKAAAKAGRVLGVEAIITGTVIRFEDSWEVNVRCVDTETASIVAAESGRATGTGLRKLTDRLTGKLLARALPSLLGKGEGAGKKEAGAGGPSGTVYGLVGSEKIKIFKDPRVNRILEENGLSVSIDWSGSRQMAGNDELGNYDFAFPSGIQNARKVSRTHGIHDYYKVFFTPMAVASYEPIAEILEANGVVRKKGGVYFLDMAGLLQLMEEGEKWSDLDDSSAYPVNKDILLTSTDLRTSNSAAMYLAIASYVANDNRVVSTEEEMRKIVPLMRRLFLSQGSQAVSSRGPFEDYLLMGMGKSPLVMIYESQFLEAAGSSELSADMVMLYPVPTIYVKEVIVPFTEAGDRFGKFMKNNEKLNRIVLEHGMHTGNSTGFIEYCKGLDLNIPRYLVEVINPPEYGIMEKMIEFIDK